MNFRMVISSRLWRLPSNAEIFIKLHLLWYVMNVFRELAAGVAFVLAVLTVRHKEPKRNLYGSISYIIGHYRTLPIKIEFCVFLISPFMVQLEVNKGVAFFEFPGFPGFLFYSVLFSGIVISIVQYKIFPKKEKIEHERIITSCGAVCSECPYFLEGVCSSCPEGDSEIRETCSLFLCARERGTACHVCDMLMRCEKYAQEREICPFEKELFPLQLGIGYVIYEKNADKSIGLFRDYVTRGEFGLLVSRRFPEQIKAKHYLESVATVWLSTSEGKDNWIDPSNLSKLHHKITDFIRNAPISIVLFEGFEYLMVRNSFLTALKFVQSLMDEVVLNKSRLILSINADAFERSELALIRRELIEL